MDNETIAGDVLGALGGLDESSIRGLVDQSIVNATESVANAQGNWVRAGAVSRKWLDVYANNPVSVLRFRIVDRLYLT